MKWPSSNARNKRVSNPRQRKQQHLLDVKIRESKERVRRFRTISGFICKTVLLVAVLGGLWFGGKEALRRFVWENEDYFLRHIEFATDGALTREQVLTAAGLAEGRNIFTIDLTQTRASLEQLPQVESAVVQRQLPNRMTVTVTERRPIASIAGKGEAHPSFSERSFLIDARGIVLRSRVILPAYYHLPIIAGFETENLVPGRRVEAWEMQAALELVQLNADNLRFQPKLIDLSKGYCLVVTDQRRTKITFGLDGLDPQLTRLNRYLDRAAADRQELATVNLLVERNTPVTFREVEEAAPAADPAAKPSPAADEKVPVKKAEAVKEKSGDASKRAEISAAKPTPKMTAPTRGSASTPPLKNPFRTNR